jgi:hypothetical protein
LQPAARLTERISILLFSFKLGLTERGNIASRATPEPLAAATTPTLLDATRISRIPWRTAIPDEVFP